MVLNKIWANSLSMAGLLLSISLIPAHAAAPSKALKCKGTEAAGTNAPTPIDPYPLNAAGWGPEVGNGLLVSRWAEDWSGMRAAGKAMPLKGIPLGDEASLTLSAEARLRYDNFSNGQLVSGNDYDQGVFRGVLGADLRFNSNLRLYSEVASGQVEGRREIASPNFQNDASLQQLFIDTRKDVGTTLVGAMLGRQEFSDGPRQLISLSDGPNIHRTWNGVRLYAHDQRFRVGAYELRATRLERGSFDEEVNSSERLRGINASFIVTQGSGPNTYFDPFWIHSENPNFKTGGKLGLDDRDTFGARLWGRQGDLRFDWTLAQQTGSYLNRDIKAWGLFTVHSLTLSNQGWKPRLTAHVDIASGGGAYGTGTHKGFNQLYASSNYLGEGQFLSLSNLLMIAPGVAVSPTAKTNISMEYGFARRLNENDAAYAGGMRPYAGTQNVSGHEIGGLLRIIGTWSAAENLTFTANFERLNAGDVLKRADLPSGSYGYIGATYRY